jgi:hypothetical protein
MLSEAKNRAALDNAGVLRFVSYRVFTLIHPQIASA